MKTTKHSTKPASRQVAANPPLAGEGANVMPKPIDDALIDRFCDHLWLEDGLSDLTLAAYRRDLKIFGTWLATARDHTLPEIVPGDIEAYLAFRFANRTHARSAARYISSLKRFCRYLLRENLIPTDPTVNLDSPKLPRALPKTLTEAEVEALLKIDDTDTALGLRDKAMLEILYATGLRVTELIGLKLMAVSLDAGVVRRRLQHHACIAVWCGDNELIGALNWFEESRNNRDRYLAAYNTHWLLAVTS